MSLRNLISPKCPSGVKTFNCGLSDQLASQVSWLSKVRNSARAWQVSSSTKAMARLNMSASLNKRC